MAAAPRPADEILRLRSLLGLAILDSEPEAMFDAVTRCAIAATEAPMALISLVDDQRQWFKSKIGLDISETSRDVAFCAYAILGDDPLVVPDARADERFCDNPLVTGEAGVSAYLGAPLHAPDGARIGTVCAIDRTPRAWSQQEIEELQALSSLVTEMLRQREVTRKTAELAQQVSDLSRDLAFAERLAEEASSLARVGGWRYDIGSDAPMWSNEVRRIHEVPDDFQPTLESAISFYARDVQQELRDALASAMQTGQPFDLELPLVTAKGRQIWVRSVGKTVFANGQPVRLVGAFQDITDQRAREEDLRNARTRAEAATRSKSIFLANMSHEIRTPLNGVTGLAGVLAGTQLTDRQREIVDLIRASGETLDRLLSDILDLSKIEAGRIDLRTQPFDLREAVNHVADLMRVRADEKGLTFDVAIRPEVEGEFLGDAARIRQIVSNLASNALKFTETGRVRISVDAGDIDASGASEVTIAVEDTGIGFDDAFASTLFSRFSQADPGQAHARGGTGLGLSISRDLARLMGGDIMARSTAGVGSTFTLTLPLQRAFPRLSEDDASLDACESAETDPLAPVAGGRGPRVLVAEDNPTNQRVAALILEAFGVQATIVGDGHAAVEAASAESFDLILMDMNMPEMDGLAAVRILRARERELGLPRTPIAMLSAYAMREHVDMAMAVGCDAHIAKPISPHSLKAGMELALERAALAADLSAAA